MNDTEVATQALIGNVDKNGGDDCHTTRDESYEADLNDSQSLRYDRYSRTVDEYDDSSPTFQL